MVLLASDYDKSRYLKAGDLKQDKKFRINAVTEEIFERDSGKEKKLVLWFTNDDRGLVLNKTNIRTIRGAFNDDTAGWIGKIIVVFPMMADFRGKMTPALRVRIPPPKQAVTATAPPQPTPTSGGGAPPTPTGLGAAAVPLAAAAAGSPLAAAARAAADPELEPDPVKPIREDLDDEVPW